ERVLVVAPAGVLRNWRHELNRWAPELRVLEVSGPQNERRWKWKANVHVKLVSYETLRNDIALARGEGASILPWDLVCLDEAQRIKNWDSDISRAARSLWAPRRWAITGTPLENSLDDVRTILSFLEPSQAGYASAFAAGDREVRERLERLQLRRKKSDVLPDLPPKMETELYVELTPEQREDYQKLLTGGVIELRDKGESVSVADVLALITRLKQVCNFSFRTGSSSKLDDVAGRLRAISEEGHKALIFSQFTSEQYGVRKLADKLSEFRPHIYTGDMSLDDRRRAVDSFQADPESRVLILSLKAGGLGLNLQAASYVFHFDRWWNPATERQAEDRSHRIGQTRGVNVYKYVCSN
ncbi:MAG: DEAD/DEAH box helicase, partial [Armatimonadota bacterium]